MNEKVKVGIQYTVSDFLRFSCFLANSKIPFEEKGTGD